MIRIGVRMNDKNRWINVKIDDKNTCKDEW